MSSITLPAPSAAARPAPSPATVLYWALRVGVGLEFIGHGMAGLAHSKGWLPYYALLGVSTHAANHLFFYLTGTVDVCLGVLVILRPMRATVAWMAFWGLFTAVLRPLVGESVFELVERGANYGMPLAFLLLAGLPTWSWSSWFGTVRPSPSLDAVRAGQVAWVARVSVALLLVGHGGLGIWAHKAEWGDFFAVLGVGRDTAGTLHLAAWVGWFEVALGLAVLLAPVRELLVFVLAWKLGTELLRPLAGQPLFQFVERSGDYALPVALLALLALDGIRGAVPSPAARREREAVVAGSPRPFPQQWHTGDGTVGRPVLQGSTR
ncbi:MAG TPA: hypothetical protein VFJ61_04590 [Solirubrobacterales bacterium]|nr:hypothetical protein [Solirubrobacterales bacterium]